MYDPEAAESPACCSIKGAAYKQLCNLSFTVGRMILICATLSD